MKTAEEIFTLIESKAVTKEVGIKLIEGYGIRQKSEVIEKIHSEICTPYSEEMKAILNRIIDGLNNMLDKAMEGIK